MEFFPPNLMQLDFHCLIFALTIYSKGTKPPKGIPSVYNSEKTRNMYLWRWLAPGFTPSHLSTINYTVTL